MIAVESMLFVSDKETLGYLMLSLAGAPFISQEECAGDLFSRGDEVLLIDLSFSDNTSPLKEKYIILL